MAERDLKTTINTRIAFKITTEENNNTAGFPGEIIDMFGFESIVFSMQLGLRFGGEGDIILIIEDSDVGDLTGFDASAEPVEDTFLIGTEADTLLDTDFTESSIGYVGKKRFVRARVVTENIGSFPNTLTFGVTAILGDAVSQPTT